MDINFKMGHYFIKEAESERKNLEEFFFAYVDSKAADDKSQ
jgi:hypothetical protein